MSLMNNFTLLYGRKSSPLGMIVQYRSWWVISEVLGSSAAKSFSTMMSVFLSALDFLTLCFFWGVFLLYNTDAHQGMNYRCTFKCYLHVMKCFVAMAENQITLSFQQFLVQRHSYGKF